MAIQFRTAQFANDSITDAKIDLASGNYNFASGSAVVSVNTPTSAKHAANKSYVDSLLQGAFWKDACEVATTGNITLSGSQTIDGVALTGDERVLVKDQTAKADNGIYVCNGSGAWARATDMDEDAEFPSAAVFIKQGTVSAELGYICTNDAVTKGVTGVEFTQFTGLGLVQAGDGLSKTGNTLDVDLAADPGLEFNIGKLRAKINSSKAMARTSAGLEVVADASKAINIDASNGLQVKADSAKALAIDGSNGLQVVADSSKALSIDGSAGLQVKADGGKALTIDSSTGLQVVADSNFGLIIDSSAGLRIDADTSTGALAFVSGQLAVNFDNTSIDINGSGELQVKDSSLGLDKQAWRPKYQEFTGSAVSSVSLGKTINANFLERVCVFRNGQRLRAVAASPSDNTEYTVATNGTITFGAALDAADIIQVDYIF